MRQHVAETEGTQGTSGERGSEPWRPHGSTPCLCSGPVWATRQWRGVRVRPCQWTAVPCSTEYESPLLWTLPASQLHQGHGIGQKVRQMVGLEAVKRHSLEVLGYRRGSPHCVLFAGSQEDSKRSDNYVFVGVTGVSRPKV